MKYWVFQNNQVNGPYGPEELSSLSFYSPESLVCPEGRRGTSMDDWQRAGLVPELSASLLKSTQLAVSGRASGSSLGGLPPEPTLRDLASLGHVQEKCVALETSLRELEEKLRQRDSDMADAHSLFKKALAEHERSMTELKSSMGAIEERIAPIPALRENLEKAKTLEHDLEEGLQNQRKSINDMTAQIESIKSGIQSLEKPKPAPAPLPMGNPIPMGNPLPMGNPRPPGGPMSTAGGAPAPFMPQAALPLTSLEPGKPVPAPLPSVIDSDIPISSLPEKKPAPASMPKAAAVPVGDQAGAKSSSEAPKSKKLVFMAVAGLVLLGGGGAWFVMNKKKPEPPMPPPEIQTPPPPEEPPAPVIPPEVIEAQMKAQALDIVKAFTDSSGKPVGPGLEALSPLVGGVAPWMTEKISEGRYQINYFAQKGGQLSKSVAFEFDVNLMDPGAKVTAKNPAAAAFLAGQPFDGLKLPGKKKIRVKPKPTSAEGEEDINQIFSDLGGEKPETTVKPAPGEDASPIDDLNLPGLDRGQTPPLDAKTPTRRKASKKAPAPAPPSDADLLDDLLKP